MRIAFLSRLNDPYAEVRINFFLSGGSEVYWIVFPIKAKQKQVTGLKIIVLRYFLLNKIPFVKRIIYGRQIRKITQKYKIDIFYIVSALNSYYLHSSKAKRNFLEIEGSDVILGPKKYPFLKYFYRYYWKFADGFTQDSELARDCAMQYMPDNVLNETIEIGIDFTIFNQSVHKGIAREKYNLGTRPVIFHSRFIGTLYNLDVIIKSIPIVKNVFPEVCYMFTGNMEDLETNTKRFIAAEDLWENIIFCGRLDHENEMKYYYADADLMVSIPSSDSSPLSVYEAMAMKVPVIVSELHWLKEKFIPGEHLIAISEINETELAEAIINLLKNESQLDLEGSFRIVYNRINMLSENEKLKQLFIRSLNS